MRGATAFGRCLCLCGAHFYSHAPCGARRQVQICVLSFLPTFLLTRPMRGATAEAEQIKQFMSISTHTPHAGRDADPQQLGQALSISTHTPHAGRDSYI